MLRSLRIVIELEAGLEVVAEASRGGEVLPLIEATRPDVALLDVQLPEADGFTCLDRIVAAFPRVAVVMVSATDHPQTVEQAERRGARAYVVKTATPEAFAEAVRAATSQASFVAVGVASAPTSDLTARELAVVEAVGRGLSNKEIARELWITEQTVKFHLGNIFRKLDVANRTEAAKVVFERGLGRTGGPAPPPAALRR